MTEADIGMLQQLTLDALPITGIVADFFAAGADKEQFTEGFDFTVETSARAASAIINLMPAFEPDQAK